MNPPDILVALTPVAEALEALRVQYYIGGSVASSVYGVARATADVDLVAQLRLEHVEPLVEGLQASYYIDGDSLREAIRRRASTNLIQLSTMIKVDVFVPKVRAHEQEVLRRVQQQVLDDADGSRTFTLPSPEDVILAKLEWYNLGNRISDRQWYDILGVLKTQGTAIDREYLREWAANLRLGDLLERALQDAGAP